MIQTISAAIERMYQLNRNANSQLVGGAYCAEISREPDGLPWAQAKVGVVNIFYPFRDYPLGRIRGSGIDIPKGTECVDWQPDVFATLEIRPESPSGELASFIDQIFSRLYGLDEPMKLSSEVFDMRGR